MFQTPLVGGDFACLNTIKFFEFIVIIIIYYKTNKYNIKHIPLQLFVSATAYIVNLNILVEILYYIG